MGSSLMGSASIGNTLHERSPWLICLAVHHSRGKLHHAY
jgi:hypothetical protein